MRQKKAPASVNGIESPWMNVEQAATYLGIAERAIYLAVASGALQSSRIGPASIRIRRAWVDEWAERLSVKS